MIVDILNFPSGNQLPDKFADSRGKMDFASYLYRRSLLTTSEFLVVVKDRAGNGIEHSQPTPQPLDQFFSDDQQTPLVTQVLRRSGASDIEELVQEWQRWRGEQIHGDTASEDGLCLAPDEAATLLERLESAEQWLDSGDVTRRLKSLEATQ